MTRRGPETTPTPTPSPTYFPADDSLDDDAVGAATTTNVGGGMARSCSSETSLADLLHNNPPPLDVAAGDDENSMDCGFPAYIAPLFSAATLTTHPLDTASNNSPYNNNSGGIGTPFTKVVPTTGISPRRRNDYDDGNDTLRELWQGQQTARRAAQREAAAIRAQTEEDAARALRRRQRRGRKKCNWEECSRRLGWADPSECRCGFFFCGEHRLAGDHKCTFDFRAQQRAHIERANPVVRACKLMSIESCPKRRQQQKPSTSSSPSSSSPLPMMPRVAAVPRLSDRELEDAINIFLGDDDTNLDDLLDWDSLDEDEVDEEYEYEYEDEEEASEDGSNDEEEETDNNYDSTEEEAKEEEEEETDDDMDEEEED